jgi:hypothetical protein
MTRFLTSAALVILPFLLAGCSLDESDAQAPDRTALGFVPGPGLEESATPVSALDPPVEEVLHGTRTGATPLRGIYLTAYAAGNPTRRQELIDLATRTEINAFVIDVKTEQGVHFRSTHPIAREVDRPGHVAIRDLPALLDELRGHGILTIARIVVFKDPLLVAARPQWSILRGDGAIWLDREGNRWVSPWDDRVWEYNISIAEEAALAGFDEIQFDYVRFPEAYSSLPTQVHPRARGDRTDAIAAFLSEARARLQPHGVPITADVFGMSMNEAGDVGIGQQWERLAVMVDGILPMVYPSHYFSTHLPGIQRPNRTPYETIVTSVGMGVIRHDRLADAGAEPGRIIPWLQAFDAPWVDRDFPYGPDQVRAQIQGVYDVGLEDWILWDPSVRYERIAAAFEAETLPRASEYDPPASLVRRMDQYEGWGMSAARDRALEREGARLTVR